MKKFRNVVFSIFLLAVAIVPAMVCSLFTANFAPEFIQGKWWAFVWIIPMLLAATPWLAFIIFFVRWIKEEL